MDFYTNKITGRYPMKGYCSNLEVEEIMLYFRRKWNYI